MSASRFGRVHKATALVPLAILSAAWTVNVTGLTQTSASASESRPPISLPDGTSLPSAPITAPASVSAPPSSSTGLSDKKASDIVATASSTGIPAAALAAYQRAATIIDDADKGCHLDWPLIAAIGRVESNHGRAEGNRLGSDGLSTPGIFGPALNGKGTSLIKDTDGGSFDGDTAYDRAVGPMQFIPSTWSMVGVDADGDGKRNPQDINDAALATAVYLCSGTEDLSSLAGQRAAVFRYNHSQSYVATVLGVAAAYRSGDYTSVPDNTVTNDWTFTPSAPPATKSHSGAGKHGHTGGGKAGNAAGASNGSSSSSSTSTPPAGGSSTGGSKSGGSSTGGGSSSSGSNGGPTSGATQPPVTLPPTKPVGEAVATVAQLTQVCTDALTGKYGSAPDKAVTACVSQLNGKTLPEAKNAVGGVVAGLADLVDSLLGGVLGGVGNLLGGNG